LAKVEPACLRKVGFPLLGKTTLVVAVEEPGNPAVAQALQRVWPQANYYSSGYNNQIMSLVFEENLATELLERKTLFVSVAGSSGVQQHRVRP